MAQAEIGEMYYQAHGTERNLNQSLYWIEQAAQANYPRAKLDLVQLQALSSPKDIHFEDAVRSMFESVRPSSSGDSAIITRPPSIGPKKSTDDRRLPTARSVVCTSFAPCWTNDGAATFVATTFPINFSKFYPAHVIETDAEMARQGGRRYRKWSGTNAIRIVVVFYLIQRNEVI